MGTSMPKARKPKVGSRDYELSVRCNATDVDRARKLAALWEMTVSQVVRRLLAQASEREGLT